MAPQFKKIAASFYKTGNGVSPARDWLRSLSDEDRRKIGADIATVEFGWPVGMPLCRSLGKGLWEVRSSLSGNRIARVIFATSTNRMVVLHGFIKKTSKTPQTEIELAQKRWKDFVP